MSKVLLKGFKPFKGLSSDTLYFSTTKKILKDSGKDNDAKGTEEQHALKKGVPNSKQQSIQEESYFNKREAEQLQDLKKKVEKEKNEKK